jgi:hypothetical protein
MVDRILSAKERFAQLHDSKHQWMVASPELTAADWGLKEGVGFNQAIASSAKTAQEDYARQGHLVNIRSTSVGSRPKRAVLEIQDAECHLCKGDVTGNYARPTRFGVVGRAFGPLTAEIDGFHRNLVDNPDFKNPVDPNVSASRANAQRELSKKKIAAFFNDRRG